MTDLIEGRKGDHRAQPSLTIDLQIRLATPLCAPRGFRVGHSIANSINQAWQSKQAMRRATSKFGFNQ
ncbi:hypothetical protein ASB57_25750 [Bordetella sp. N]|nr:hypothetical protein ASB57_25750 [Bordetella sp. N]